MKRFIIQILPKKKGLKKNLVKGNKIFLKKKKTRSENKYKNLPEDEKQRLVEYRKKDYKIWKNKTVSQKSD